MARVDMCNVSIIENDDSAKAVMFVHEVCQYSMITQLHEVLAAICMESLFYAENSWMWDPRYKHEYLDRAQSWLTITEEGNDESDKQ